MLSKTSFSDNGSLQTGEQTGVAISWFNPTVFKKNLTRFAPVWVVYGLLVCICIVMIYSDNAVGNEWGRLLGFVHSFSYGMVEVFMYWNLGYALLAAQLLFGDLYNSRMCNALHAMPLRRETWFLTNFLSGLAFSLVPTFAAFLVLLPMLSISIVENAWVLAVLWLLAVNLQFVCCFGIASFAAICVGSRFTMAAGYGLIQFGAYIAYWLVDTVYTPMLYGVHTPSTLANALTPLAHMANYKYVSIENMVYEYQLLEKGLSLSDMSLQFTLTENWWRLFAIAGVGILFAGLAVLLYRLRDLECAGDAVAFPILKPVFQVLCALFVMCTGEFVLRYILGMSNASAFIMTIGLVAGWFVGKMLIERSTRVFRLKNWYGLGVLAVVLVLTLAATKLDVLNIEERLPDKDKIESVTFETNRTSSLEVEESQWDDIIRIHELAVEHRVEEQGLYIVEADGNRVLYQSDPYQVMTEDKTWPDVEELLGYEEYVYAGNIRITYNFKDGSYMMRRYNIWTDGEIGRLTRKNLSSWESLTFDMVDVDGELVKVLDAAMDNFVRMSISGYSYKDMPVSLDKEDAEDFLKAVKLDAAAGLMIQDDTFHRGVFVGEEEDYYGETYTDTRENLYVSIESTVGSWDVRVYPDCVNSMNWLIDKGLVNYTVYPDAIVMPG